MNKKNIKSNLNMQQKNNNNFKNNDLFLLEKLMNNELKFHELDNLTENADKIRLVYLEKKLNINLEGISKSILSVSECKGNIENMIGSVQIPLGIAGPVFINGDYANGDFFLPLATTEGALVASVNRGCKILNNSKIDVLIINDEQTRSLLFKAKNIREVKKFLIWVEKNFEKLKKIGEETSNHLEIRKIETYVLGLNIWLRIKAFTNEAMGMNMITIAGKNIADYIMKNYNDFKISNKINTDNSTDNKGNNIEFVSETGNLCVDKKPSYMNLINSRGKKVIASAEIDNEYLEKNYNIKVDYLIDLNYRKNLLGSAFSGSLGYNAHFANIIAALFLATGQDLAHVVEGSLGFTTIEKINNKINFSVTLNSLQIGTIGGGTKLKTQKESLILLGCQGKNSALKLAEIISVSVLAGEISLLIALAKKELSKAHQKLNREKVLLV